MKVVIVGPGAVGSLFAYFLSKTEPDLWLLDRDPARAGVLDSDGILVEELDGGSCRITPRVSADPAGIGRADLVIICVKAGDTAEAAGAIRPVVGADTVVLTLQNGMGNVEKITAALTEGTVLGGTTAQGSTVLELGRIRHAGAGETIIGEPDRPHGSRTADLVALFKACGMDASATDDLERLLWGKLVINVGINALTAITGLKNGELVERPGTLEILREAVAEALAVAGAKGIALPYDDPVDKVESVCRATAANISSMLQDMLRRRRTEIDAINQVIVTEGERLGVPTPVNRTLAGLVRTIERSWDARVS